MRRFGITGKREGGNGRLRRSRVSVKCRTPAVERAMGRLGLIAAAFGAETRGKSMSYLRKGVSGEPVKLLQAKLGVPADGVFGPATETALKAYQQKNGLAADGVAGPDTFLRLGLGELVLLAQGSRGDAVKKLQEALGIPADGHFGPAPSRHPMASRPMASPDP
jgi:murein L,D-transpeptidase YcbB/YkuD